MRISDWSSDVCSSDLGFDLSLSETVRDDLHQRAKRIWPGVGALPVIGHWAGLRPYANRAAPLLEAVEGQSGLSVATGHYRLGLTLAPASATRLQDRKGVESGQGVSVSVELGGHCHTKETNTKRQTP